MCIVPTEECRSQEDAEARKPEIEHRSLGKTSAQHTLRSQGGQEQERKAGRLGRNYPITREACGGGERPNDEYTGHA